MPKSKPTYLALGDSYTIGEGVKTNERWPVLLSKELNWKSPQIIATTGWTTSELLQGIKDSNLKSSYDWVSLLIGVNNQYRGQSIEDYQEDLEKLAEIMLELVDQEAQRIFVVSIPDYGVTPFAEDRNPKKISEEVASFNHVNLNFAQKYSFQYCSIYRQSLLALEHLEYLTEDQLHPSGLMYQEWVKTILATCNFS